MLTRDDLARVFPRARGDVLDAMAEAWDSVARRFGLKTPTRVGYFLAQVSHESSRMTRFEESLTYTTAKRIRDVWPRRFKTLKDAAPFVRAPEALAERVYGGRMGNGPEGSGDGYRYRGRGPMQITGRDGYEQISRIAGLPLVDEPELAAAPEHLLLVAAAVWHWKAGNTYADRDDFVGLTRAINGGTVGLADRRTELARILPIVEAAFARAAAPSGLADDPAATSHAPVPAARPGGAPAPVPKALVEAVQRALAGAGYHEVGLLDGKVGSRTRGAILAFQADNSLPLDGVPSTELLAAIEAASRRPVSPERAAGKPEESRIVAASDGAAAVGGTGAVIGVVSAAGPVIEQIETVSSYGERIRVALDPLRDLLGSVWPVILIAAGVAVVVFALRARRARIEDYRAGKTAR